MSKENASSQESNAENRDGDRDEFLNELRRLAEKLGRTPRSIDLKEYSDYSLGQFVYRFDSWNNALREAGFEPNQETLSKEEKLIVEIQRLAEELGRVPYHDDMTEHGKYGYRTYYRRFGSWDESLERAGFDPYDRRKLTDEDLLNELERLRDELGRVPTQKAMDEQGKYSVPTYQDRFGSWNDALYEAGLDPNHVVNIPEDKLLEALEQLVDEIGRTPKRDEMDELGEYSGSAYDRNFNGWNDALRRIGLKPIMRSDIPDEELLDAIHRLHDELGYVPRSIDMWKRGEFSVSAYRRCFGSWNNAIEAAGYETWEYPTGSDNPNWNGGYRGDYGPNWDEQREKRLEHDNFRCIACGMTRPEHYDKFGRDLIVHHVTRKEAFRRPDGSLDYERANRVGNLRTLCDDHHSDWEGLPVGPVLYTD